MPFSLPDTIKYEDFIGTHKEYWDHLYDVFLNDFYTNSVFFLGKKVLAQKHPEMDGKVYSFNHITKYEDLHPNVDINRSKKIPWLAAILNSCPHPSVKCWEFNHRYRGKWVKRVNVWTESVHYLIILQQKGDVYYLITAITKGGRRNIRKLNEKYNNSSSKLY